MSRSLEGLEGGDVEILQPWCRKRTALESARIGWLEVHVHYTPGIVTEHSTNVLTRYMTVRNLARGSGSK